MNIVRTKEELEMAFKSDADEVVIEGELATHVHHGSRIRKLGPIALGFLLCAIAAVPLTGGLSAAALTATITITGVEAVMIVAAVALGIGLVKALGADWHEVEFEFGPPPKARLRRKPKK